LATYKQLQDQIARLQREAETTKQAEIATVVDRLKKQIALYGLTAADVGFGDAPAAIGRRRAARKAASRPKPRRLGTEQGGRPGAGVAKYRDPKTGKTWSGFGRVPTWLASVKDRTRFLIDASQPDGSGAAEAEAPAAVAEPASKAARKVRARKTVAKTAAAKRSVERSGSATAKRPAVKKRARAKTAAPGPATGADSSTPSGTASQAPGEGRSVDAAAAG